MPLTPDALRARRSAPGRARRGTNRGLAQIAATLSEPHVIPIHDYGEIDGRSACPGTVHGVDLAAVLRRDGPFAPERAVAVVEQVGAALDAAHEDGLVHRDVKPPNVLVRPGPPEFVYLADFGIARPASPSTSAKLTGTGATLGTLDYMAPELFLGRPLDHRVDVYALACVLFDCSPGVRRTWASGRCSCAATSTCRRPRLPSTVPTRRLHSGT